VGRRTQEDAEDEEEEEEEAGGAGGSDRVQDPTSKEWLLQNSRSHLVGSAP